MPQTILFIGHSADYTGAPLVLLRLCKWLKNNTNFNIEIILKTEGPLQHEYEKIAPVHIYHKPILSTLRSEKYARSIAKHNNYVAAVHVQLASLLIKYLKIYKLKRSFPIGSIDLIFSNTLTNGEILESLSYINCPVICRVAELENWIQRAGKTNFALIEKNVNRFIAVSKIVKNNLVINHHISPKIITIVPGFIDVTDKNCLQSIEKNEFGIPQDAIIIGGSGGNSWLKGKDIFIQLAVTILNHFTKIPMYFVWLGGKNSGVEYSQLVHDIEKTGFKEKIILIPTVQNPLDYFTLFDIFAMVSREDSYPTINLEVGSLQIPIVCFDNAGGSPEFVENDAGFIVPYLDINAMVAKIITLAEDKNLRKQLGKRAREKVIEKHSVSIGSGKIYQIIQDCLKAM